jgi:hypothetical protein
MKINAELIPNGRALRPTPPLLIKKVLNIEAFG